jgi:anti-anti-sigma factor
MHLESSTLPDDIVRLRLSGRLDFEGVQAIDERFALATTTRIAKIIVDLSEVSFLASIGIRMLLASARAQARQGGTLLFAAPQPIVRKVLESAGIDQIAGLVEDIESALAVLSQRDVPKGDPSVRRGFNRER